MTAELVVLALASTIRPTSLAAVYAILASDAPRRLMTVYIAVGVVFTIAVGLLILGAVDSIGTQPGSSDAKAVAELVGGLVALGYGVLMLTGRVAGPNVDEAREVSPKWAGLRDRRLTLGGAAVAGPVTHIPGLFYLIALNLIAGSESKAPQAVLEVLIFNALWFALPIATLAICVAKPTTAQTVVGAAEAWTRRHAREIVTVASLTVGAILVVRGVLGL